MLENTYNEYGEIIAGHNEMKLADLVSYHAYMIGVRKIAPIQVFGLIVSLALMVTLLVHSCLLHRKITKRNIALTTTWSPMSKTGKSSAAFLFSSAATANAFLQSRATGKIHGRHAGGYDDDGVPRTNSGIIMMRSRSQQTKDFRKSPGQPGNPRGGGVAENGIMA
jgi:hypothetical protein